MKKNILITIVFVSTLCFGQNNDTIFFKNGQSLQVYNVVGVEGDLLQYIRSQNTKQSGIDTTMILRYAKYKRNPLAKDSVFTYDNFGFNTFIVKNVPNKTQEELYQKAINWISVTYNTPKEVLKGEIKNDYLRIEGIKNGLFCQNVLMKYCYDTKYMIEISFKNGKYKFEIISIKAYYPPSQYSIGGWTDNMLLDKKFLFKENNEIRNMYKDFPESFCNYFNNLNNDLFNFFIKNELPSKSSDW